MKYVMLGKVHSSNDKSYMLYSLFYMILHNTMWWGKVIIQNYFAYVWYVMCFYVLHFLLILYVPLCNLFCLLLCVVHVIRFHMLIRVLPTYSPSGREHVLGDQDQQKKIMPLLWSYSLFWSASFLLRDRCLVLCYVTCFLDLRCMICTQ